MLNGMFLINAGNFQETAHENPISPACGTTFCRIEDAELGFVDDAEVKAGLLLTGPTERNHGQTSFTGFQTNEGQQQPLENEREVRRPTRRFARLLDRIQRARINIPPLKVNPTSSTISAPGSQSGAGYSRPLWTCCNCGDSGVATHAMSCYCGQYRCKDCYVYSRIE